MEARYVHTNLIAKDWRRLAQFYVEVFGCILLSPERDLSGPDLEAGTGVASAAIQGAHLRFPGFDDSGPTLEIFQYTNNLPSLSPAVNRPGFGHIAFAVDDVISARQEVLTAGGQAVGSVVSTQISGDAKVTWCYVTDVEGNVIELQSRS